MNNLLNSNRTAVIVLNWNKPKITIDCVESLNTMEGEYDIFVIDNGSDEIKRNKLIEEMKKQHAIILNEENINDFEINFDKAGNSSGNNNDNSNEKNNPKGKLTLLILLNKNYGYSKGNNFGLRLAYRLGYKYSLVSNNDIKIIDKNVLIKLIKETETDERIAWTSPKIMNVKGYQEGPFPEFDFINLCFFRDGIFYPFHALFMRKKRKREEQKLLSKFNERQLNPVWSTGCFAFLKNEAANKVNFFDENIFLYMEELIIAEKLRKIGFVPKYVPNVKVLHEHYYSMERYNFKREYEGVKSLIYYYYYYKNYNIFILNTAKLSRLFYLIVYKPVIVIIKKILNRLNRV